MKVSLKESIFIFNITENFVQELRLPGLILGASYKDCLQNPAFGTVAAFFSEMYQFTFWFVLLHGMPRGRIDWLMRGVFERSFSETTSVSFLGETLRKNMHSLAH
jgi:hypothetical protein